jgi:hypothetical protein
MGPPECIIHLQTSLVKPWNLKHAVTAVVSAVTFIRSRGIKHREFNVFLDEIKSEYGGTVYCSQVRWLHSGEVEQVFCHCWKRSKFSVLKKDNLSLTLNM